MIEANIQQTILRNLLSNEEYLRKVIPFLKKEYFESEHKILFNEVVSFVHKYNELPTKESITVDMTAAGVNGLANDDHVYAVNYNVLRIMSGMGGLAYSN